MWLLFLSIFCILISANKSVNITISNQALRKYEESKDPLKIIEWKQKLVDIEKSDNVTTFGIAVKVPAEGDYIKCVREKDDGEWANSVCDESWTHLNQSEIFHGKIERDSRNYADHYHQTLMVMVLGKIQMENAEKKIRSDEWVFTWTKNDLAKKKTLPRLVMIWLARYFLVSVVVIIFAIIMYAICCCSVEELDEEEITIQNPPNAKV